MRCGFSLLAKGRKWAMGGPEAHRAAAFGGRMLKTEAFQEFRQALARMRDHDPQTALTHMHRAVALETHNPFYLSYLGVAQAHAERKWAEAEQLCETAVRMKPDEPQLYVNLAEVYVTAGRRDDALGTLNRGLLYAPRDRRIQAALNKLSFRRPPILRFLPRRHFLNRNLGRLRHRTLELFGKA